MEMGLAGFDFDFMIQCYPLHYLFFIMALQALAAIPSINSEAVQQRLDHVRTYYELLNMPFEASHLN
jgi:hypothetical protein